MRVPLATDYKTRTGVPDKDARVSNGYVETRGEQSVVRKRPVARGGVAIGTGTAQGGIGFSIGGTDYLIGFWGDTLNTYTGSGTTWSGATAYLVGDHVSVEFVDYWAAEDNTNSDPTSNPSIWSTTFIPVGIRYRGSVAGYLGSISSTKDGAAQSAVDAFPYHSCATRFPATQGWITFAYVLSDKIYVNQWNTVDACATSQDLGILQLTPSDVVVQV